MYKSLIIYHKFISIYSDGCLCIDNLPSNIFKSKKKLTVYKKDYKLFQKLSKNTLNKKKKNNYRNKIF